MWFYRARPSWDLGMCCACECAAWSRRLLSRSALSCARCARAGRVPKAPTPPPHASLDVIPQSETFACATDRFKPRSIVTVYRTTPSRPGRPKRNRTQRPGPTFPVTLRVEWAALPFCANYSRACIRCDLCSGRGKSGATSIVCAGDAHSSSRQYKCMDAAMKQHRSPATGPTLLYRSKRLISDTGGAHAILS